MIGLSWIRKTLLWSISLVHSGRRLDARSRPETGMGYGRHLRQRGGATHFRRVVPEDLRARIGRREIVRSIGVLRTFERHSASRRFCLACDEVFVWCVRNTL